MSEGAAIVARLGLDATEFREGMMQAGRTAAGAHGTMAHAAGHNAAAHDHLFVSSHKMTRQLTNFTQVIGSGASGAQIFAAGLEAVERSMHLPFGTLAGLAIGALLIEQLHEVSEEAEKSEKALKKIAASDFGAASSSVEVLKSHITEAAAEMKKAREVRESFMGQFKMAVLDANLLPRAFMGEKGIKTHSDDAKGREHEAQELIQHSADEVAEKMREQNDLQRMINAGNERGAELKKREIELEEKLGALRRESLATGIDTQGQAQALIDGHELWKQGRETRDAEKDSARLKDTQHERAAKEAALGIETAKITRESLGAQMTAHERIADLSRQILSLSEQMQGNDATRTAELGKQRAELQKQRRELEIQHGLATPAQRRDAKRQKQREQRVANRVDRTAAGAANAEAVKLEAEAYKEKAFGHTGHAFELNARAKAIRGSVHPKGEGGKGVNLGPIEGKLDNIINSGIPIKVANL